MSSKKKKFTQPLEENNPQKEIAVQGAASTITTKTAASRRAKAGKLKGDIINEDSEMPALKEKDYFRPLFTSTRMGRNSLPTQDPDVPQKAAPKAAPIGEPVNLFTSRVQLFDPTTYSDDVNGILKKYPYGYDTNSMLFAVSITYTEERLFDPQIRIVILSTKESRPYYIRKLNKLILLYIFYFKHIYFNGRQQFFYVGSLDNQIVPQGRYGIHQDVLTTQYSSESQKILLYAFTAATRAYRDQLASIFRDNNGNPYTYKGVDIATFGAIQYAIIDVHMTNTTFKIPDDDTVLLSTHGPMTSVDIATSTYVNFIAHHTTPRKEYLADRLFIDTVLSYINIFKTFWGNNINVEEFTDKVVNEYTQSNYTNIKNYNAIFDDYKGYNRAMRRLLFILYDNLLIDANFTTLFDKLITDFKTNQDTKIIFHNTANGQVLVDATGRDIVVEADKRIINIDTQANPMNFLLNNNYIGRPFDESRVPGDPTYVETFFANIDNSCVSDCIYQSDDPIIQEIDIKAIEMRLKEKQRHEYIVAPAEGKMQVFGGKHRKSKRNKSKRRNTKKKYNQKKRRSSQKKNNKKRRSRKR